ncbi:MAG TPA: hypothetical protein VN325_14490 [Steroidobacteraceae bacterium]|nr:hypothetical protein [Steroidobacteraceae bacterium]
MNETKLATLEQIREFLAGTSDVTFTIPADDAQLRSFVGTVIRARRLGCGCVIRAWRI